MSLFLYGVSALASQGAGGWSCFELPAPPRFCQAAAVVLSRWAGENHLIKGWQPKAATAPTKATALCLRPKHNVGCLARWWKHSMGEVAARRVVAFADNCNGLGCPTGVNAPIEIKRHSGTTSNKKAPNILAQYMKPEHKRMSRMLGYCLTLGNPDGWAGFRFVASIRLTPNERAALAFAALTSLEPDEAEMTAAAAIGSAGAPLPPFLGGIDEARFWASYANRSELKAYALAAFEAMVAKDQAAFLAYVKGAKVA